MGSWVVLALCGGEVQRGNTAEEFGASIEVQAGAGSAEVRGQRFEAVTLAGRVDDIKSGWELQGHPDGLAGAAGSLFGRHQLAGDRLNWWRFSGQQQFKGKGQCVLLSRLDEQGPDVTFFLLGGLKRHDELRGRCLGLE